MAPLPIYNKKSFENLFLRIERLMTLKLGMLHWELRPYHVCPNGDPWLTLAFFFKSRSDWVT